MRGLIILFKELRLYLKGKQAYGQCFKQEIQFSLNTERTDVYEKHFLGKAFTSSFLLPSWVPKWEASPGGDPAGPPTGKVLRESQALREALCPQQSSSVCAGHFLLWLPALAPFRTPSYTQSGSVGLSLSATSACLSAPGAAACTCPHPGSHCPEHGGNQATSTAALARSPGGPLAVGRPPWSPGPSSPASHLPGASTSHRPVQGADPHTLRSHPPRPTHGPRLPPRSHAGL